ncbi:MAG: hypothetical protein B7X86_08425 [Sphingobacteriales bacterium 17-39-43]|uniref:hypothetical protein n=1 Tax=Daejeonella sp. TaxID=2805397 RepID=UPI000BCDBA78|nr:hypothetical protein [Daejeonella sp.]OYZ33383.1 MAG: hypothetical protein B7Y24_03440 [Sphingobacteriales bacterium 16-39-50]OZA24426.1 MAG: hypothetical protein B7X86_08425 [Sphingobacteriales bacterium 17-39-43]HQT22400.1 hypothetical protein [Daejeonella sp.]HQT56759.1 hypothetical protein [Daejeonella sp.]
MKTENSDKDWLKEAPTLAKISRENPFAVPSAYFESLNENLNTLAKLESVRFENEDEFSLPENYFNQLAGRIEDQIAIEAIQNLAPADGFKVPDAYFNSLAERINSRIDEKQAPAKLKNMFPSWIRYSAAASVVFVIGIFFYFNSSSYIFNKQLSKVPDQDIINYLQFHSTVNDNQYLIENITEDGLQQVSADVSEEDIEQYINSTTL